MRKMTKILALLLVIATLMGMAVGCKKKSGSAPGGTTAPSTVTPGEAGTYTVTVKDIAGSAMQGLTVYVYGDEALSDLKSYGTTNETGVATIELAAGNHYIVVDAPKGYTTEKYYSFNGTTAEILLSSALITEDDISTAKLGLGDIMYDFSVTKPDGSTIKLSDVLKEKKVALLNFWYTTCTYCIQEFPLMQSAYEQYSDKVGIIALNPMNPTAEVGNFQTANGLTFDMAACPASWSSVFDVQGYPTTVVVDRYGRICLVESGALLTERLWTSLFEHFTADNYEQKLLNFAGDLLTQVKPNVEMPTQEELQQIMNPQGINVTYRADEDEYAWPFVVTEKDGVKCLMAPNKQLDDSYAIIYFDVELKAGQAIGIDYMRSSEATADILHVIVNDEPIYSISGVDNPAKWETCYPVVADQDGTYEIAMCYIKDSSDSEGDDTMYLKNLRLVDAKNIDKPTYIPRKPATSADGFEFSYAKLVYSSRDGYYHIESEKGPLLLVDIMNYTEFSEETTLWELINAGTVKVGDKDYTELLVRYANYASNSNLNGICPVTKELYEAMIALDQVHGFDEADKMEWLKACKYFQAYGTGGAQLEDPIKGLAPFSAYKATEGKNVSSNYFYYNRIIMPRGMLAEFIPSKSGVYRINSRTDSTNGVEGWIFDQNSNELLVYERDERMFEDGEEISMVFYMEKGKKYYIDIAFWDPYEVGYIYYDISYIASSYDLFRLCSQGYFTYDTDATGSAMYDVIAGGIDVVLGSDGYYYQDLGGGKEGSKIYADFTGLTSLFNSPIATVGSVEGLIDKGAFDFSKTENDQYVLTALAVNGGDKEKTKEYLKKEWSTDYETLYEEYKVDDVLAGIYHGEGKDYTSAIKAYLGKMINDGNEERKGCVLVDKNLAEILQALMDKFTFEGVENSWLKLCYYYDHLG